MSEAWLADTKCPGGSSSDGSRRGASSGWLGSRVGKNFPTPPVEHVDEKPRHHPAATAAVERATNSGDLKEVADPFDPPTG